MQKIRVLSYITLALLLFLAACATTNPVTPTPTLSVSPPSATVTVGGAAVSFSATLTNSSDTIVWSLDSGPGINLPDTGPTTSYTPPASGGAATATLTATAGSLTASATITINPPASITVAGKVVDIFGQVRSGLPVKIGSTSANTDSNGNFSISNVTVPYDVIVIDSAANSGYLFKGLSRTDPTLQLFAFGGTPDNSATIQGQLSGGVGFPNPADHVSRVIFGSDDGSGGTFMGPAVGPAYGPFTVSWSGNATTNGNLHALQWKRDTNNLPEDYTGYGSQALSISNGGAFSSPATDINLSSGVADTSLSGSATLPSGYTINSKVLWADWGTNQSLPLLFDSSTGTNFTYTTPNIANTNITARVTADEPSGFGFSAAYVTGLAPNATTASLTVPEIPEQILPVNNAADVTNSTSFSWQPFGGGVHVAFFGVGGTNYYVITTDSQTTIPDLSAEGLPLPASAGSTWQVVGIAPFADMDAATGPSGYAADFIKAFFGFAAPESNGGFGLTFSRNFTTAP